MATQPKVREKTPKAVAQAPPAKLFIERQEGAYVEYGGVGFTLKGLTWQEDARVESIQAASYQAVWANHKDSRPELDDFDFQVADVLRLRLGTHEVKALPGCPPEVAAAVEMANQSRKEMTIGEEKRLVLSREFFSRLDTRVTKQFLDKIEELSKLSEAEEIKLVFTSPQ